MTTDKKNEVPPVDMQAIRGQLSQAQAEVEMLRGSIMREAR